jgi:hypothetical protein
MSMCAAVSSLILSNWWLYTLVRNCGSAITFGCFGCCAPAEIAISKDIAIKTTKDFAITVAAPDGPVAHAFAAKVLVNPVLPCHSRMPLDLNLDDHLAIATKYRHRRAQRYFVLVGQSTNLCVVPRSFITAPSLLKSSLRASRRGRYGTRPRFEVSSTSRSADHGSVTVIFPLPLAH